MGSILIFIKSDEAIHYYVNESHCLSPTNNNTTPQIMAEMCRQINTRTEPINSPGFPFYPAVYLQANRADRISTVMDCDVLALVQDKEDFLTASLTGKTYISLTQV